MQGLAQAHDVSGVQRVVHLGDAFRGVGEEQPDDPLDEVRVAEVREARERDLVEDRDILLAALGGRMNG